MRPSVLATASGETKMKSMALLILFIFLSAAGDLLAGTKIQNQDLPPSMSVTGTLNAETSFTQNGSSTISNNINGNAATATAAVSLSANGTNCLAGEVPRGVDAQGNSENCTTTGAGDVVSNLPNAFSGNNTHSGSETFSSTATFTANASSGSYLANSLYSNLMVKAAGSFVGNGTGTGGPQALHYGVNISSVMRRAAGEFEIYFIVPFVSSLTYVCTGICADPASAGLGFINNAGRDGHGSFTGHVFPAACSNTVNNSNQADNVSFICTGKQ
jgi:hypothetical protein